MLDFRDSDQEMENYGFDKDFNGDMLWFGSLGRMLDFRDSGQEIEDDSFDKDCNKEVLWFWIVPKHWTNAGFQGFWSGDRRRCS